MEPIAEPSVVLAEGSYLKMLTVRINVSGKALTVDELLGQKKSIHISAFQYMVNELEGELKSIEQEQRNKKSNVPAHIQTGTETLQFLDQLVEKCKAVLKKHDAIDAKEYTQEATYRELVAEMLETKSAALSSLRLVLEDDTVRMADVSKLSLVDGRRQYLGFLERQVNYYSEDASTRDLHDREAQKICRAMGILRETVDERDADGMTRLMVAAADGEGLKAVRMLVAARANVNAAEERRGYTPLCLAAESGQADTAEVLLELKADVNVRTKTDEVPIIIAASHGHEDVIEALIDNGAHVNARNREGRSALHAAVDLGFEDAVKKLVKGKADVNLRCNQGKSPLDLAESSEQQRRWGGRSSDVANILRTAAGKSSTQCSDSNLHSKTSGGSHGTSGAHPPPPRAVTRGGGGGGGGGGRSGRSSGGGGRGRNGSRSRSGSRGRQSSGDDS